MTKRCVWPYLTTNSAHGSSKAGGGSAKLNALRNPLSRLQAHAAIHQTACRWRQAAVAGIVCYSQFLSPAVGQPVPCGKGSQPSLAAEEAQRIHQTACRWRQAAVAGIVWYSQLLSPAVGQPIPCGKGSHPSPAAAEAAHPVPGPPLPQEMGRGRVASPAAADVTLPLPAFPCGTGSAAELALPLPAFPCRRGTRLDR
jgi:hypothetical protein